MHALSITGFWPLHHGSDPTVVRDADRLIRVYGGRAHETAGIYSWREDIGLLFTRKPGHWHRVRLEIGRRIGTDAEADPTSRCTIQALHLM